MSQSLAALERQRSAVLSEIIDLGDFRSGSISAISGRCGKPDCRCHQPAHLFTGIAGNGDQHLEHTTASRPLRNRAPS